MGLASALTNFVRSGSKYVLDAHRVSEPQRSSYCAKASRIVDPIGFRIELQATSRAESEHARQAAPF